MNFKGRFAYSQIRMKEFASFVLHIYSHFLALKTEIVKIEMTNMMPR